MLVSWGVLNALSLKGRCMEANRNIHICVCECIYIYVYLLYIYIIYIYIFIFMYAHFMKLDTYLYIYKYTVSIMMCIYISLSNIWLSTISRFSPLQVSMLAGYERQAFQSGPFWFQGSVPASVETVGVGWMWQKTGFVVDIGGSVFVEVETIPSKTTIITNKRRLILQFILFFLCFCWVLIFILTKLWRWSQCHTAARPGLLLCRCLSLEQTSNKVTM